MPNNFSLLMRKVLLAVILASSICSCENPQNFDKVSPPDLPIGWTSSGEDGKKWVTVADSEVDRPSDTAPNSVFVPSFNNQDVSLTSPLITLANGGSSEISFKHRCKTENKFDGMILEVSPNETPFINIENYGPFLEGPYVDLAAQLLGFSKAWSGENNYVLTRIAMPNFLPGTTLRFRFRSLSDNSVAGTGCSLDSLNFKGADLIVSTLENKDPALSSDEIIYSVSVKNLGPLTANNIQVSDILPTNFTVSSISLSQGVLNVSTAPVLSASLGNLSEGQTATMTVKGKVSSLSATAAIVQLFQLSKALRNVTASGAAFGPALQASGAQANVVIANDGSGDTEDACQTFPDGNVASGSTLLIRQSNNCSFNQQVKNAELAGAAAAIIYNASNDQLVTMASSGLPISIPSVFIGSTDGTFIHNFINLFGPLNASLTAVSNGLVNEAVATSSVFDPDLTNSFSTEVTTITVPDSDGDGVVDSLDLCPSNLVKVNPGICGCSVLDQDLNSNGAIDCLATADLKAQAQKLQKSLKALKYLKSNASPQQKAAQALAKTNLKSDLNSLLKIIKNAGVNISLSNKSVTLKAFSAAIKTSVSSALKLKSSFTKDKNSATKNIKNLIKAF